MPTEHEQVLQEISSKLRGKIEALFYYDSQQGSPLIVYVFVKQRFDDHYFCVLDVEDFINKNFSVKVDFHVWDTQGRPTEGCKPPGAKMWSM